MTRRRICLAAILGLLATSLLFGQQGVVKTRDGRTFQGEIEDKPEAVTITIHGVRTTIPRDDIESVEIIVSAVADLKARVARLDPQDVNGRVQLAREAFGIRDYDLAREILDSALAIDADHTEARRMLEIVNGQIRLERTKVEPPPAPAPPRPQPVPPAQVERRLLTPADIEAIHRKELKSNDKDVRIRFYGDVKRRFAESQNMTYAEFNQKGAVEQALAIWNDGDASMREQVRIQSDPPALREFKTQIQPMVISSCATTACHGGGAGAGLVLFNPAENDALSYTNFYILQSYARKLGTGGGVFGDGSKRMINRGRGDESLLANYGLPAAISEYDHPLVNGRAITPAFRNKEDAKYKMVVSWMNDALSQFEPEYGIHYTPPIAAPVTMPATQPAP
jgi:hypothetical protein